MTSFRRLLPFEAPEIRRHLLSLTPDERRLRFQGAISDDGVADHVDRLDWSRTVVVGFLVAGRVRGIAEAVIEPGSQPPAAELAVTVETAWQHRHVGTEMTRRAVVALQNRGVRRLSMICLVENGPMRRIAAALPASLRFDEGAIAADYDVAPSTPLTHWCELVAESAGLMRDAAGRLMER